MYLRYLLQSKLAHLSCGNYPVVDTAKIHDLLFPTILLTHQFVDLVVQVADLKVGYAAYVYKVRKQQLISIQSSKSLSCQHYEHKM